MSSEFGVNISGLLLSLFPFPAGGFPFSLPLPPNLLSSFSWLYWYVVSGSSLGLFDIEQIHNVIVENGISDATYVAWMKLSDKERQEYQTYLDSCFQNIQSILPTSV